MAGPLFLRADPGWSTQLWSPALAPPVPEPLDAGGPSIRALLTVLADHWTGLPRVARAALALRCGLRVLLGVMGGGLVVLLTMLVALVTHVCVVWTGVALMMKVSQPPLMMVLVMHVPGLRISSWVGGLLARALMGGLAQHHRAWRADLAAELCGHGTRRALQRRSGSAPSSSTGVPVVGGRVEPRLF